MSAARGVKPPIPLTGEALQFWRRHRGRLEKAGVLTPADMDSFAVLCLTWGKVQALAGVEPSADTYREMIQLVNLLKQYQSLARQFGLLPRDRRTGRLDPNPRTPPDEFGL